MVWGAISGEGAGPLYFVEGKMNSFKYLQMLKKFFVPYFRIVEENEPGHMFMQDGAPSHTAKIVKNYLIKEKIPILDWPANSPDLNPIENVWNRLKSLVYNRRNPNIHILKQNIREIWHRSEEIDQCIKNCIASMPRRIQATRAAKGGHTKY